MKIFMQIIIPNLLSNIIDFKVIIFQPDSLKKDH